MTFAELGIHFPLFEASIEETNDYAGAGTCCVCQKQQPHCFELSIGCALMLPCPSCRTINGLDADDKTDTPCFACATTVPWPLSPETAVTICYACLREGHGAITHDTEQGMLTWQDTTQESLGTTIPRKHLLELLRTPGYITLQCDCWQFCCHQPMVYLGPWSREEFTRRSPDGDGESFFNEIVQEPDEDLWEDKMHDETGVYVFRCAKCARLTAHWDIA
jgi:uncharacterized protein CbrC (UPF0167 family)